MSIVLIAASLWPRARSSLVSSSWPGVGGGGTAFIATGFFFRFFAVGAARATPSGH